MELMMYLILIALLVICIVLSFYFYSSIIYSVIIMLSLLGFIIAINSPVEISTGEVRIYDNGGDKYIENIYYQPTAINTGFILLFIATFFGSILAWSTENKVY